MSPALICPGDTVGILGGGQLGRMLALAAARLGLKSHIFAPQTDSPAFEVAPLHTIADYRDEAALASFAAAVSIITYEFENVPEETAAFLARRRPVRPNPRALAISQDRLAEKEFLNALGLTTAPFRGINDVPALIGAIEQLGIPSILKSRRFGYDGKGQALVRGDCDPATLFRSIGARPSILEGFVRFEREISVVAARGLDGAFRAYDVCENLHQNHILAKTIVPAALSTETVAQAFAMTQAIADALDYVGVIAVEMFALSHPASGTVEGSGLVVNEFAPRVHNSGHWTLDGAVTSQFEQHIRAICGWPLGSPRRHGPVEMVNLIGGQSANWQAILNEDGACLHLYGKSQSRPGRKMGHVTRIK